MKYYLLFIEDDIEPVLHGPYPAQTEQLIAAKQLRNTHGIEAGGIFPLNIDEQSIPSVYSFSGAFFDDPITVGK